MGKEGDILLTLNRKGARRIVIKILRVVMNLPRRVVVLAAAVILATAVILWTCFRLLPPPQNDPLFTGGPECVVLSLTVALGLYLRQANLHALDLRDKIENGEAMKNPHERKSADRKVRQLEKASDAIMLVSPYVILLMLIAGCRIVADDVCRFFYDAKHPPRILYAADAVIAFGLLGMLFGLVWAHFDARIEDGAIRRLIQAEKKRMALEA